MFPKSLYISAELSNNLVVINDTSYLNLKVLGIIAGVSFVVFKKHPSNINLVIKTISRHLSGYQQLNGSVVWVNFLQILNFSKIMDNNFNVLIECNNKNIV